MRSSPFFSRTSVVSFISLLPFISAQSIGGGVFRNGSGAPGAAPYELVDEYLPDTFFDNFNFFTGGDPTYGHVQYVDRATALRNGYATTTDGAARMSVDSTNKFPLGGRGRPAVRLTSNNSYTHGMFIADVKHMPSGCGTWPAYWLLGPDPWPTYGEIDIIEGVHDSTENGISMHTTDGCSIAGSDQSATLQTTNCFYQANYNSGCGSKLEAATIPNNYGKPLNDNGGGVYVTEWTASYVKHWFFPRGAVPSSIEASAPDISEFGKPAVNQQGPGCTIDEHFGNMNIIINTDFCGAWAGEVYSNFPECPQNPAYNKSLDRCVDYVGNNPSAFTEAYWDFNSIRVYQMPPSAEPVSSYSTSLASTQPLPSTNTINAGMGRSSSSISSVPYTGPLSTLTSTSSLAETKSSTSTPELPDESAFFSNYVPTTTSPIYTFAVTVSSTGSSTSTPELPDESAFFSNNFSTTTSPIYPSSVMASSTAGPSTSAACPGMNDQLITAPDGRVYHLYCSSDTSSEQGAYDIKDFPEGSNYDSCFSMCTADASCAAFIWKVGTITNGGGTCYFKRGAQTPLSSPNRPDLWAFVLVSRNSSPTPPSGVATPSANGQTLTSSKSIGITSAMGSVSVSVVDTPPTSSAQPKATSAPCPYADGTEYVSSSGKVYQITCFKDESSNPSSSAYVSADYALCVDECEKTTGCVSITYSAFGGGGTGGFCSFRNSAGLLTPSDDSDVHLNLIPGKTSIIGPTTTTTTTKSSSSSSLSAIVSSSVGAGMGSTSATSTNGGTTSSGYQPTMSASPIPDEAQPDPSTTMSDGDDAPSVSTTSDDGDMPTSTMSDGGDQASTTVSTTSSLGSTLTSTISSSGSTSRTSSSGAILTSISLPSLSLTAYPSPTSLISSSSSAGSASSVMASPSSTSSVGSGSGSSTTLSPSVKTSTASGDPTVSLMTSASASALPNANPACDSVFMDPWGESYLVKCSTDSTSISFRTVPVYSGGFGSCFGACESTQHCVGFTYIGSESGNCYLKSSAGTLFSANGDTYTSAFKLSTLGYSSTSQRPSTSVSAAASGSSGSLSGSSSQSSGALIPTSMSMSSRATTSSTPSSGGASSSTSNSRYSSVSYTPLPACPTSSSYYCTESNQQTTCSSGNNNYAIQCGILYEGTEIDTSNINEVSSTSNITAKNDDTATSGMSGTNDTSAAGATSDMDMSRLVKRATLPDAASCRSLCDRTSGCKAFNFVGNNCTLFSTVSGYSYAPGAIGGTVYTQGGAPPTPVDTSPSCPASAGKSFTNSMSTMYEIVCYTQYASDYTSDAPFPADNLANCLPSCAKNAGCAGAVFDTTTRLCQLLAAVNGVQTTNNNLIAALRVGGPPAYASPSSVPPTTVTTTLLPTSTLSLSSGATITISPSQPVEVVTSTIEVTAPSGGSFTSVSSGSYYVYPTSSVTSAPIPVGGGGVTICFTCGLTPVVTPGGDIPTSPPALVLTSSIPGNYNPTCAARPPLTGTTTVYTTYIVTTCDPQPTCPNSGYFIYTGTSRPGQEVVTTTNSGGSSYVFTQVPANVTPMVTGTGGGGGGGPTVTAPGGAADPTCPANNGEIYTGPMGMQYEILCDTRFIDDTLETQTQDRLGSCISACEMYNTLTFYLGSQCLGINYYGEKSTNNCLLKAGSNGVREIGTTAARLVTPRPGGNGTGPGSGPGQYGSTIIATMSASPIVTTAPGTGPGTGPGPTATETTTTLLISYVPSTIYAVSTAVSTYTSNGVQYITSYGVSTAVSVSYIPAPTQTETTTTLSIRYVPSTIYAVSTAVSTYTSNGVQYISSYGVSTAVSVSYIPAPTQTETTTTTAYVPSTVYAVSTSVSIYTSNGIQYVTSIGVTTAVSVSYVLAPTQTLTTTATATSYVPSTVYEIRTTVSTYVSNGISYVTSYGVSTAVSVSYIPQTASTNTVTTTMISISVSDRTVSGATVTIGSGPGTGAGTRPGTGAGSTVTVTATPTGQNTYGPGGSGGSGGGVVTMTTGGGGYVTVTMGDGSGGTTMVSTTTVFVTQTVAPSSRSASSSTFTCRTYATNYLNAAVPTGAIKRADKRSVFEAEFVISENDKTPRPGGLPELWYHGLEPAVEELIEDYLE